MKQVLYGEDARRALLSGVSDIAKAVKVTLGPSGRNVMIRNTSESRPFSTKDGVTVAAQIASDDPITMAAIESIQDIANQSDEKAGDGTTTATVIGEAIVMEGMDIPKDLNLLDIKRGIDQTVSLVVEELKKCAIDIQEDDAMLKQVALISSNYDEEIADIVFRAFKVSGNQGIVNIKRSKTHDSYLTTIKGMTLPMGYRSRYYVTSAENDTCVMEEPYVFMTNKKISKLTPNIDALLHQVAEKDIPLLIIAPDIDPVISDMLIRNKMDGAIKVCVCRPAGFGNEQTEILKDLGVVLGKAPFIENEGLDFEDIAAEDILDYIPRSESITVGEQMTSISGALASTEEEEEKIVFAMNARADKLRDELSEVKTQYEKAQLQMRISRLSDGIAYVHIGATSDTDYIEKQGRIQDALYAIKSANEEGIVPGGGAALFYLGRNLEISSRIGNESTYYGGNIVLRAIQKPFLQIIENVGVKLSKKQLHDCGNSLMAGYNAKTERVVKDMIKEGVVDPVKVTRVALESAASIAGMLLTTECLIVDSAVYDKNDLIHGS
jgi:chaperonin GroEL